MVWRPGSILRLILYGFLAVALPLVALLGYTLARVQALADLSQQSIVQSAAAVHRSGMLERQLLVMERLARQSLVLDSLELQDAYAERRMALRRTLFGLLQLPMPDAVHAQARQMLAQEAALAAQVRPGALDDAALAAQFAQLDQAAREIYREVDRAVGARVVALERQTDEIRAPLLPIVALMLGLTVLLALVFILLIARPIRMLKREILRLGNGEFATPVVVAGPSDVRRLGEDLDWMRQRLVALEASKTRFLRELSHELKTPLAALREGVQLLADGVPTPPAPAQREIIGILDRSARQLQRRIEALLQFSVAQRKPDPDRHEPLQFDALVRSVVADYQPQIMRARLEVRLALTAVALCADQEKLKTVVDNLMSNAVRHSPAGGRIEIRLHTEPPWAVLEVLDQGPGVPLAAREAIFEAFYRGPDTGGPVRGTGLGLAIVREHVQAHEGHVEVVEREGWGGAFRVSMPCPAPVDR